MNKLSLFSGIGGDDLASEWAGIETICFVEKDKYCQRVLQKHWPGTPIVEDVKDVNRETIMAYANNGRQSRVLGEALSGREDSPISNSKPSGRSESGQAVFGVDIISGGFPCQPHSVAGKRKGSSDERNLWPEFRRIIGEIKPRWVVAENVPGLFSSDAGRFFGEVLSDLASLGYSVGWCTFGAVDVGAWHRRDRVFIVGYSKHYGQPTTEVARGSGERGDNSEAGAESSGEPTGSDKRSMAYARLFGQEKCQEQATGTIQCGQADVPYSPEWQDNGRERGDLEEEAGSGRCVNPAVIPCREDVADTQCQSHGHGQCGRGEILWQESANRYLQGWWAVEPDVGRVANGVPHRVDRLRGLGNAVVPQQIYPIYKAIVESE